MSKTTVKVTLDGQQFEFESMVCSGCTSGAEHEPTAFYFGRRDVGEMGVNLMYMLRSILKICRTEYGMPKGVGEELIKECLQEASRRDHYDIDHQTVMRRVFDQK